MFANILIAGTVSADPQFGKSARNIFYAYFYVNVARYNSKDKDKYKVLAWGKQAMTIKGYLKKGMSVMVYGKLALNSYRDKKGQERFDAQITLRDMEFLPYVKVKKPKSDKIKEEEFPL